MTSLESQAEDISILKEAQKRKETNLDFFKSFHPAIYKKFYGYKLKEYNVSLISKNGQLDIMHKGASLYNSMPLAEALEEVADFESKFAPGMRLHTVQPPFGGYDFPRMYHKRCNDLIAMSPIKRKHYKGYIIPEFYPMIAFMGVGCGYHIQKMIEKHEVLNVLIAERDPEIFACSLYTMDWTSICQDYIKKKNKNIHFIVGPVVDNYQFTANVFRYLSSHCPIYPLTTLFINHLNDEENKKTIKKINEDTKSFTTSWGFYDDEINQLNNCIHNINLKIPVNLILKSEMR